MNILFALMKSGVLPVVEKEDILSIGSWHLIKNVDEEVVEGVSSGHDLTIYDEHDDDAVISYGKLCWAGTDVPEYDYSKMLGVDYRWLNFTPSLPYGMIPVAPIEFEAELKKTNTPYVVSDWKKGFVDGKSVAAKDFGAVMKETAGKGAANMPVVVKGASWSAIRLDEKHIRLILVDPGYIDPQEREVEIKLQGQAPVSATDILSGEKLKIANSSINLKIPAGSMRFVDLVYKNENNK